MAITVRISGCAIGKAKAYSWHSVSAPKRPEGNDVEIILIVRGIPKDVSIAKALQDMKDTGLFDSAKTSFAGIFVTIYCLDQPDELIEEMRGMGVDNRLSFRMRDELLLRLCPPQVSTDNKADDTKNASGTQDATS